MRTRLSLLTVLALASVAIPGSAETDYNRQIRPILADHCFACHGPDARARKAGLRLDLREDALKPAKSGAVAIIPGDATRGELLARITASDADEIMPPPKSRKELSPAQIELLRQWISEGAVYQKHWAFEPPVRSPVENLPAGAASTGAIDTRVAAKLREHGLTFSPEAAPDTLLRRVTLDLTGLPPTLEELEVFQAELRLPGASLDACYERAVDRLLRSAHFGEHLAVAWLDAARYADTNGYFGDKPRQMWLWRDWVIGAFNANMPFDQFTIEQLAGDLLPGATISQRIATGFNRNHMANNESGIIDEEFRTEYVVDRLDTTMTTWMGLTAGCAQCHDHKFDPISQREFYGLFAFFNSVPESGLIRADNPPPLIEVSSPEQQRELKRLSVKSAEAVKAFAPMQQALEAQIAAWEPGAEGALPAPPDDGAWHEPFPGRLRPDCVPRGTTLVFERGVRGVAAKFDATQHAEASLPGFDRDQPWTIGMWLNAEGPLGCPLSLIEPAGHRRGIEMIWQKGHLQVNLVHRWGASAIEIATIEPMSSKSWHHVVVGYDGTRKAMGLRVFVDGAPAAFEVRRDTLDGTLAGHEPLRLGRRDSGLGFYGLLDEVRLVRGQLDESTIRDWYWGERIRGILEVPAAKRHAADAEILMDYYIDRFADAGTQAARRRVKAAKREELQLRESLPTTLVMQEMPSPRVTHILDRGQYDKPLAAVPAGVPSQIAPWPAALPGNRLGFARWLVSPDNPLTARVAVNRLWQHCFGEGLVRTANDFGTQGEPPTHPELLDWLALTFRDSGWDVKAMLKRIVMSRTYRQQSAVRVDSDPDNRLLARGPGGRLSAEMLRDQALTVSGLLATRIGGPGVKPYQPPGLWEAVSYNGEESYVPDTDDGLWRRSIYTYVKRQAPPPSLLTFDGPTREKCAVRRARTNTPLQALLLLNDETFVEAARVLAARALESAGDDKARLRQLWRRVLMREGNADEVAQLCGLLQRQRERFARNGEDATKLLAVGATDDGSKHDPIELAAWTVVAQTVLNLDETISKR